MKLKAMYLAVSLLLLTPAAQADSMQDVMKSLVKDVKPGLWEIQQKTVVDGQELPDLSKMLESVPPEMRAQVEAMMSKNASRLVSGKPMQTCITAEQLAKQAQENDANSRCQFHNIQREGNRTHVTMQCAKPKGQGESTVTRINSEAWTSVTKMTIEEQGSTHKVDSEAQARWISADCSAMKQQVSEVEKKKQKQLRKQQEQELRRAAIQALEDGDSGE